MILHFQILIKFGSCNIRVYIYIHIVPQVLQFLVLFHRFRFTLVCASHMAHGLISSVSWLRSEDCWHCSWQRVSLNVFVYCLLIIIRCDQDLEHCQRWFQQCHLEKRVKFWKSGRCGLRGGGRSFGMFNCLTQSEDSLARDNDSSTYFYWHGMHWMHPICCWGREAILPWTRLQALKEIHDSYIQLWC